MERKSWQNIVIGICLCVMFFNRFLPEINGISQIGVSTICIFASAMVLLILVDVTWPLLLCITAYTVSGVYSLSQAIQMSFGHHLFVFTFLNTVLMAALRECGVLRRIAIYLISRPFARKSAWRFIMGLYIGELVLGYFMNCTALMVLFLGLTEQIFNTLEIKKGSRLASFILLGELIFCAVSYGASPIGHALVIMSFGIFEGLQTISYVQFLIVGGVVTVLSFVIYMVMLRFVFRLDVSRIEEFDVDSLKEGMEPISREEIISLGVFIAVVIVWLLPGLVQNSMPNVYRVLNGLGVTFPVVAGVLALCILTNKKKPYLNYSERLKTDASWNAAYPIAMAMLNSSSLTNPEAGITTFLADRLGPVLGNLPGIVFVIFICLACTLIATFSSPTVGLMLTGTVVYTLLSGGVITGVNAGTMTVLLAICAALVVATPCSTYGALTFGSGWVNRKIQFTAGGIMAAAICLITGTLAFFTAQIVI